jgi:hypothetical protein
MSVSFPPKVAATAFDPSRHYPKQLASVCGASMPGGETAGGLMDRQSKLDLAAAGAILVMFLGAYGLTVSRWGLLLIVAGVIAMLFLLSTAVRTG